MLSSAQDSCQENAEQAAAVLWVQSVSAVKLTEKAAKNIVEHAYAQADKQDIDPMLVLAVARTESGFKATAKSSEGAAGLMQVMPRYHKKALAGRSAFNPEVSIEVGVGILKYCSDKSKENVLKTLNCYSGGGGKKYMSRVLSYKKELSTHVYRALFVPPEPAVVYAVNSF